MGRGGGEKSEEGEGEVGGGGERELLFANVTPTQEVYNM